MLHRVNTSSMKIPRPFLVPLVAALLALPGVGVRAQDDGFGAAIEPDALGSDALDEAVYAALMPNPDVVDPARVRSAIPAAWAVPDTRPKSFVPITAVLAKPGPKP